MSSGNKDILKGVKQNGRCENGVYVEQESNMAVKVNMRRVLSGSKAIQHIRLVGMMVIPLSKVTTI